MGNDKERGGGYNPHPRWVKTLKLVVPAPELGEKMGLRCHAAHNVHHTLCYGCQPFQYPPLYKLRQCTQLLCLL